ncbi:PepSY-like domain-containing protein [uncultured Alistipes sp.]|jgi:hypothetical protein|uniref:PepSY-like domain-containing protein n=1 Tax=uncultured Alistipes sp. TaxID=538949 RepID=UPI000D7A6DFC|nr:PepSY-like domain-containing protein [uncultured Alistipes sp.]PWM44128.1 MAG: hypothetical protein DBX43_02565 [Coriobacteriia bacterium]
MKRIGIIGLLLALVGMLGLQSCDDEREISYGKLPSLARAFIETYFPDQSVSYAERDKDDGRREYSVVLSNGTEIDFDQNGDWESVDCKFSVLPEGIVPQSIAEDMAIRYPDAKAYKIERQLGGYELSIGQGRELVYAADGTFIREQFD